MRKIFFLVCVIIVFACCNNTKANDEALYKQHKAGLEEKEKQNPLAFLKVTGGDKRNLIGQTIVKGKITNTATVCTYKNVRIKCCAIKTTGGCRSMKM